MSDAKTSRREFLTRMGQGVAVAATGGLIWSYLLRQQAQASPAAIRPPGALEESDFNAKCIKCGQCVRACPYDTLTLATVGEAVPIGTPYYTPREVPCYMCEDIPCKVACPTGALDPGLDNIDESRMGLAVIDIENCLSWQGLRCEICHRECPVQGKAITVEHHPRKLSKHAMFVPIVHSNHCTGCGICEKACPTDEAAIRVLPHKLVQGKIGEHYRLGWTVDTPVTQKFKPGTGGESGDGTAARRAGLPERGWVVTAASKPVKLGPNGRPVRAFVMPDTLRDKLTVWRYIILRRVTQIGVLLLFFGTAHWGWTLAGQPILVGNLSASEFLGLIPLADPFAVAQILLTQHVLESKVLIGAGIVLVFYGLLGGRVWCSWICPINMVTDLAGWLRIRLGIRDMFRLSRNIRYIVLVLALVLSALTGVAAFEWVSPISMMHRELIFGLGMGWTAVLGVFLFDLLVLKHGWCGHICPLGAFYALVGRVAPVRVWFDTPTCTHCGECAKVCPEPQVLNLKQAAATGMISSGECTNCGRCITVCPEDTLHFDLRSRITSESQPPKLDPHQRRPA